MRKHHFANGGFYHIFNRGVDKRIIFSEKADFGRFLRGMQVFNTVKPIGSMHEYSFAKDKIGNRIAKSPLVNIVCYCLNPNHYHLVLEQIKEGGISAFMQRLSTGFTQYFNHKYKRSGVLFQGKFKSVPIVINEQMLHVSAYVNLNDRVHGLQRHASVSSWKEYIGDSHNEMCKKNIVLNQFHGIEEYKDFAKGALVGMQERKKESKEFKNLFFE